MPRNIEQHYKYAGGACVRCNRSVQESIVRFSSCKRQYSFHHVDPTTKSDEYDNLIRRSLSAGQLDEIDKCILVCNTCHGLLEECALKGTLTISASIDGRTVEQKLACNLMYDRIANKVSIYTSDRYKLNAYRVHAGSKPPMDLLEIELLDHGRLVNLIRELPETRSFRVFNQTRCVAEAEHLNERSFRMRYDVSFPLIGEFNSEEYSIFTRNTMALSTQGEVMGQGYEMTFEADYAYVIEEQ